MGRVWLRKGAIAGIVCRRLRCIVWHSSQLQPLSKNHDILMVNREHASQLVSQPSAVIFERASQQLEHGYYT